MPNPSVKLLLSCVSGEFGEHRDALRRALTRPNVEVKIQEDFKALGGDTLNMLEEYVEQCEAVVHFVGDMAGSAPAASSVDDLLRRRPKLEARLAEKGLGLDALKSLTYTQWEAWLAIGLNKNLVIVQPAESVARGPNYSPSDASRAAQAQHLDRLRAIDRYPGPPFTSADNLVAQIFSSAVIDALVKAGAQPLSIDIQEPGLAEALERDFQRRYAQATQRSMFPELLKTDLIRNLANELREGNAAALPAGLRRTIFLRAARSRALRNDVAEAGEFFSAGLALPGSEGELAARARIAEARATAKVPSASYAMKRKPTAAPFSSTSLPSTRAMPPPLTGFGINLFLPSISRSMASWRCVKSTCAGRISPRSKRYSPA
jgi:hypothetical protein